MNELSINDLTDDEMKILALIRSHPGSEEPVKTLLQMLPPRPDLSGSEAI